MTVWYPPKSQWMHCHMAWEQPSCRRSTRHGDQSPMLCAQWATPSATMIRQKNKPFFNHMVMWIVCRLQSREDHHWDTPQSACSAYLKQTVQVSSSHRLICIRHPSCSREGSQHSWYTVTTSLNFYSTRPGFGRAGWTACVCTHQPTPGKQRMAWTIPSSTKFRFHIFNFYGVLPQRMARREQTYHRTWTILVRKRRSNLIGEDFLSCGSSAVVPVEMRDKRLGKLLQGHQGIQCCRLKANRSVDYQFILLILGTYHN